MIVSLAFAHYHVRVPYSFDSRWQTVSQVLHLSSLALLLAMWREMLNSPLIWRSIDPKCYKVSALTRSSKYNRFVNPCMHPIHSSDIAHCVFPLTLRNKHGMKLESASLSVLFHTTANPRCLHSAVVNPAIKKSSVLNALWISLAKWICIDILSIWYFVVRN